MILVPIAIGRRFLIFDLMCNKLFLNFIKLYKIPFLFAVFSIAVYFSFAYNLERSDFIRLISLYAALFFIAYIFIEKLKLNFWFFGLVGNHFPIDFYCCNSKSFPGFLSVFVGWATARTRDKPIFIYA